MENWEFLLQKQGDKSWLPLESPTVEILEGQYRLASRTKFVDALVGIKLRYIPLSDSVYEPSQQKIAKRVNPAGLLIVMPYTNFTPGSWRIECSEIDGLERKEPQYTPWLVSVQLEVQSVSAEIAGDWYLNLSMPNPDEQSDPQEQGLEIESPSSEPEQTAETDTGEEVIADRSELVLAECNTSEGELALPIDAQSLASLNEISAKSHVTEAIAVIPPALPYNLIALNQSQYLVTAAQMPILSGQSYLPGELEVVLRNPQDLETVISARFALGALGDRSEPINFSFELCVPVQTSQVMIGEVKLHPSVGVVTDSQPHIYSQAISLTYQSPDILAEVAQEITTASQLQLAKLQSELFDASTPSRPLPQVGSEHNLSNLKLPQLPLESSPVRSTNEQKGTEFTSSPKLPQLPRIAPLPGYRAQLALSDRSPDKSMSEISEETQPNIEVLTGDLEISSGFEVVSMGESKSLVEDLPTDTLVDRQPQAIFSETEEQSIVTLQSPLISDRFLDKLQAISRESVNESLIEQQVNEFIDAEVEKLESEIDKSLGLEDLDNAFEQMLIADELLVGSDVQIEAEAETSPIPISQGVDTMEIPTGVTNVTHTESSENLSEQDTAESQLPLPEIIYQQPESSTSDAVYEILAASKVIDRSTANNNSGVWPTLGTNEPVPLPILEIPQGEAVSGVTFPILIKLPAIAPKLFVKFWVKDCQTRHIIDGPRWLVDFQTESDTNFMMARTPITLPLGTMEVAFEAIAVEMQTQRESRKTSTTRSVTLPNLVQENDVDFELP